MEESVRFLKSCGPLDRAGSIPALGTLFTTMFIGANGFGVWSQSVAGVGM